MLMKKIGELEQELLTPEDIEMYMKAQLSIKSHPIPEGMIGQLFTIDGIPQAAEAIFYHLENRAKLFGGHVKPHEEVKDE